MKKAMIWIVLAVAVVAGIALAFRPSGGGGGIRTVDAAGVTKSQAAGAEVVDVRTAGEFEMGHIPGATNVPVDEVQATAASWDRDKTYVIYCATGSRSAAAVATMQSMGFKNIDHFASGVQAWTGTLDKGAAKASGTIETAGKPVFVEFYTNSWPSCIKMKPLVEGLEKTYKDKIEFRIYNVEDDEAGVALAQKLNVQYVPTFLLVNSDGTITKTLVGEQSEKDLVAGIEALK